MGVDSAFLLKMAVDTLGDNVIAVLSNSETYPTREFKSSVKFAEDIGVELMVISTYETDDLKFKENPPDRCYFCKTELYSKLKEIAGEKGIQYVLDGSNLDDKGDFRPGNEGGQGTEYLQSSCRCSVYERGYPFHVKKTRPADMG